MNAFATLPVALIGRIGSLVFRIVAFLASHLRGADAGTSLAVTAETRARIPALTAPIVASTRDFTRLATLVRSGEQRAAAAKARWRACVRAGSGDCAQEAPAGEMPAAAAQSRWSGRTGAPADTPSLAAHSLCAPSLCAPSLCAPSFGVRTVDAVSCDLAQARGIRRRR